MDQTGHDAQKPSQIPSRGWGQIARRVASELGEDRVMLVAAGVTFYLLLALPPTLALIVAIYGLVTSPAEVGQQMQAVSPYLPSGVQSIVQNQLDRLTQQTSTTLGFASVFSFLLALWSANRGTKGILQALNIAYDERETRGFFKLLVVSLAFTLGGVLLFAILLSGIVAIPRLSNWLPFGELGALAVKVLTGLVVLAIATFGLACLFRWGPDRRSARWSWLTPGAAVALIIAAIASLLFSWYVSNFGSYDRTYGSLGIVIVFMTWLWIMAIFLLLGAELNAEMEHQTARDTTVGPERPMGERGARMADTVASRQHIDPGAAAGA
ncbi:MAG: YihY/virulence factor BrkB family protein [Burkholderiaceae bacterium]